MIDVPETALGFGFRNEPGGRQLRRTLSLAELRLLLAACPVDASAELYRAAVLDENALLKGTAEARLTSYDVLRGRFALDPRVRLFRALRDLWDADGAAQPLLAFLCATARDPVLRATAEVVLPAAPGAEVPTGELAAEIAERFPGRFGATTVAVGARLASSSWQQAGLLTGRNPKVRAAGDPRPVSVAYALLLGHLCGARGEGLFGTLWARVLDAPVHRLRELAAAASRQGWIDYRHAGAVTEVGFGFLLRDREVRS